MIVMNEGDVREGMDVIGLDGVSVGTVDTVWIKQEPGANPHDLARGMPRLSSDGRDGHFLVRDEDLDLYMPFEAIAILFPGQNLTVSCTADECRDRYTREPASLSTSRQVQAATSR